MKIIPSCKLTWQAGKSPLYVGNTSSNGPCSNCYASLPEGSSFNSCLFLPTTKLPKDQIIWGCLGMSGVCSRGMLGFPYQQETPIKNQKKKVHRTKLVKAWGCNSLKSMPKPQSLYARSEKHSSEKVKFYVPSYRNIYIYIYIHIHLYTYTWMALDIPNLPYEWNTYWNKFVIWISTCSIQIWLGYPTSLKGKKTVQVLECECIFQVDVRF